MSYNIQNYSKAVVNKGESFVGTQGKSAVEWTDWSDIITDLKEHDASVWEAGFDYDNLSLRAYTKGNLLTVENKTVKEKKRYTEGDVIEGSVTIRNEVAVGDVYNIEKICRTSQQILRPQQHYRSLIFLQKLQLRQ